MANNGTITIKFVEGNKKVPGPEAINDKQDKDKEELSTLDTFVTSALFHRAVSQLKNLAISEAKYQMDLYYRMNDNYMGQQTMNIALNVINKVVSVGTSIYTGAKLGFKIGAGWGAVAGAAIATGISGANIGLSIVHNYNEERIRLNQMNANLRFNRERAGYSLTAGSIGEGF